LPLERPKAAFEIGWLIGDLDDAEGCSVVQLAPDDGRVDAFDDLVLGTEIVVEEEDAPAGFERLVDQARPAESMKETSARSSTRRRWPSPCRRHSSVRTVGAVAARGTPRRATSPSTSAGPG
jgi:hypothetical protein